MNKRQQILSDMSEELVNSDMSDVFDQLENRACELDDEINMGKKVVIHDELKKTIARIEKEINLLSENFDKLDNEQTKKKMTQVVSEINDKKRINFYIFIFKIITIIIIVNKNR